MPSGLLTLLVLACYQIQVVSAVSCCRIPEGAFVSHQKQGNGNIQSCTQGPPYPGSGADRSFLCRPNVVLNYTHKTNAFSFHLFMPNEQFPSSRSFFARCLDKNGQSIGHTVGGYHCGDVPYQTEFTSGLPGLNFSCAPTDTMQVWSFDMSPAERDNCNDHVL